MFDRFRLAAGPAVWTRLALAHPAATVFAIAFATALAAAGLPSLDTDVGYRAFLGRSHPDVTVFDAFLGTYDAGLPLVAVVIPIFKLVPILYRWRMRSKIYRWYSKLPAFDPERHKGEEIERLREYQSELERIEEKVSNISVPLAFSEELYHLRMHIELLQTKLEKTIQKKL